MSDVRDTAPADSTKPAACGACGAKESYPRDHVRQRRGTVKYQWQQVCIECWAAGPLCDTKEDAALAWDTMWAPRAGEATAKIIRRLYCMSCVTVGGEHRRVGLAFEERTDDNRFNAWVGFGEIDAALAELGLAGGEGRG